VLTGSLDPEEELLKAKLVREIRGISKRRKLIQTQAAVTLGLKSAVIESKHETQRFLQPLHRRMITVVHLPMLRSANRRAAQYGGQTQLP
jgi:hypothetical protein